MTTIKTAVALAAATFASLAISVLANAATRHTFATA